MKCPERPHPRIGVRFRHARGQFLVHGVAREIETIGRIAAVPAILEAVAHTTGLRFVAVARVTDTTWTACAVHDRIDFGLEPSGQLVLESTICNEIRQHHQPVVFGHARQDPRFATHPTPRLYGFESYISVPIFRVNGDFFGTIQGPDYRSVKRRSREFPAIAVMHRVKIQTAVHVSRVNFCIRGFHKK